MRASLALLVALLASGCVSSSGVDLEVRYTGISVAELHVRLTSPGLDPTRWYFNVPVDDGEMDWAYDDVLLVESIDFDALDADQEDWDVLAWIDLQGDEDFICQTDPLNAVECAPDLQDKDERFRFTLLAEGRTAVNVVIDD